MTRYADPRHCPDCGASISPGASSCPTCELSLSGDTAGRLFATLSLADELLVALRAASVPSAAAASAPTAAPFAAPFPDRDPDRHRQRGLSAASVPRLLLALGAGCLLVAALVFLAVTWSVMGVGGRTATLVVFTALAGGLAAWTARRGLRGAPESLALVGYGLLALDVVGADNAGWFGDLSTAGLLVTAGVVLAGAGATGAVVVRRTAASALRAGEVVVAIGTALVSFGFGVAEWMPTSPSLLVSTLVGAAAAAVAYRLRMSAATAGAAVVAGLAWLSLTAVAIDRVFAHSTWSALWLDLEIWPLLVAAALVALVALLRQLPRAVRIGAASIGEMLAVVGVVAPFEGADATSLTLVAIGVLVVVGVIGWLLPRPWGLASAATQVGAAAALLLGAGVQATVAVGRLVEGAEPVWSGRLADRLGTVTEPGVSAPWLLPVVVFVLLATLAVLAEGSAVVARDVSAVAELQVAVVALLAASVVGALALYPVALWLVVGVLLVLTVVFTTWSLASRAGAPLAPAGLFATAALVVSLHSVWLSLASLVVTLAVTGLVHLRSRPDSLSATSGALFAAGVAGSALTAGRLLDADRPWVALFGLLALGGLALGAPYLPRRWWLSDTPVLCRTGLEVGAAAAALPLALAGVLLAPGAHDATWAAVYLTAAGVATTLTSLLREDRHTFGWVGGGLLALASWVRLWDIGVQAPEAYTLPSAAMLAGVGLLHLRRRPEASTMTALAPGLSLALVPSLLWVLADPTGPRALLLGLGCLALVLVGLPLRWSAPVTLGATVGALLVLRLATPYVGDAVPRWVLIGGAGALLIGIGATWERRLSEARQLMSQVRALR